MHIFDFSSRSIVLKKFWITFWERNRIELWLRKLKEKTKRSYNNVNSKAVKAWRSWSKL